MAKSEPKYLKTTKEEVRLYLEAKKKLTTSSCYGGGRSSIEVGNSSGFDYNHGDICGLVFYHPGRVDIGLTKINNDNLIPDMRFRSVYPPKDITGKARDDFFDGRGYAVVQGKLFAIGGGSIYGRINDKPETEVVDGLLFYKTMNTRYPLVAHVCDLQKIFSSSDDEHLEFELAVYMKGPKEFPLVVPYKKKIFVLSNPGKHDQFLTPTPFEVLSLSNDGVTVEVEADPPFWKQGQFISMEAHAVAESRLYICVLSKNKNISFTYTLYCFDMDNSQWVQQEMSSFPGRSFEKTVEKLEQKKIAPYHILASFLKEERSFICYHSGKSFQFDCEDTSNPSLLVIYDKKSGEGVPVKDVVESMKLEGRARDGWVLGVDENKSDVYFLIVWVEKPLNDNEFDTVNYIRGCKFKLLDDYGSCEILIPGDSWGYEFGTVPEFGPVPDCADHLCLAFTRSNSRDPKADYYQCYMAHKMYSKEW